MQHEHPGWNRISYGGRRIGRHSRTARSGATSPLLPPQQFTRLRWSTFGGLLMQYLGLARYNEVGMIVVAITAVVWSMDWLSSKVRSAIA